VQANPGVSPDDPRVQQTVNQFLRETRAERLDLFDRDAWRTLIFLLLATTALFLYRRQKLPAWALQGALALLVVIDLFGVGRRYFNEDLLRPTPEVEANIPQTGYDQFILEAQAEAGEALYEQHCLTCHDKKYFRPVLKTWSGQPLGILYTMMSASMPQSNPGSLPRKDYVEILAYILSLNRYPAGDSELDYEDGALDEITIVERSPN